MGHHEVNVPRSETMPDSRMHLRFAASLAVMVVLFWAPLSALAVFFYSSDYYSYALMIPLISAGLIVLGRKRIFLQSTPSPRLGVLLTASGVLLFQIARWLPNLNASGRLSLTTVCLVLIWIGLFLFFYGSKAWRAALFPLLLLFFMVPLPDHVFAAAISLLQKGSAAVSYRLIQTLGVPVLRRGMVLSLPGLDVEVAPQCSGIRSSIALVILTSVAAYLYLRAGWHRLLLVIAVAPVVILKNAIRISAVSLLAAYVDHSFLTGNLHRKGGALFFLIGVVLLMPLFVLLHRLEAVGEGRSGETKFNPGPSFPPSVN